MTTAAPYLNVPEYPDDPSLDLADAIERAGDALSACVDKAASIGRHDLRTLRLATDALERVREAVDELQVAVGAG